MFKFLDNSKIHVRFGWLQGLNQEFDSDTEAYDEDAELGEEYSQSEVDEVSNEEDSEEVKSDESEEDNIDEQATAAVLEKLVPCIDEYAKVQNSPTSAIMDIVFLLILNSNV